MTRYKLSSFTLQNEDNYILPRRVLGQHSIRRSGNSQTLVMTVLAIPHPA